MAFKHATISFMYIIPILPLLLLLDPNDCLHSEAVGSEAREMEMAEERGGGLPGRTDHFNPNFDLGIQATAAAGLIRSSAL